MEVYALVGKSGTGKSYKAQYVAGMFNINYIIDDGLFIFGNKVVAGISAKGEKTKIAAIKRAIFEDKAHRGSVKEAINAYDPDKILIVGTSEHMIQNIMKALEMGEDYSLIKIEEISTTEEIEAAVYARKVKGKHVIPVPTFEIKKRFSGYFIDSIRQLVKRDEKQEENYEKTIVRPTFSYLGSYEVKDGVLKSIIASAALEVEDVYQIHAIDIDGMQEGAIITISTGLNYHGSLQVIAENMCRNVRDKFEYMTGINILEINVKIKSIKGAWR